MRTSILALTLLCSPVTSWAQTTATVTTSAPIYVTATPGPSLAPLRVAAVGTIFKVVGQDAEWLQVQFEDPQWGRRTGWVQKRNVTVSDPHLRPMDLSIRDTQSAPPLDRITTDGAARRDLATQGPASVTPPQQEFPPTQRPGRRQTREGFWFNAGLGLGSLGCNDCTAARVNGLSGGLSLGGRVSDRVLLGVGTAGWARETATGEMVSVGLLDARVRVYPVRTSGFFLTGGAGLGSVSFADGDSEFGLGLILGVGWDIRVGRNVSLTPFWNGFAMANDTTDRNVGQLGIGVTIH